LETLKSQLPVPFLTRPCLQPKTLGNPAPRPRFPANSVYARIPGRVPQNQSDVVSARSALNEFQPTRKTKLAFPGYTLGKRAVLIPLTPTPRSRTAGWHNFAPRVGVIALHTPICRPGLLLAIKQNRYPCGVRLSSTIRFYNEYLDTPWPSPPNAQWPQTSTI